MKVTYKQIYRSILLLCTVVELKFFNLLSITRNINMKGMVFISFLSVIMIVIYSCHNYYAKLKGSMHLFLFYVVLMFCSLGIECIYSMERYDQTIMDMVIMIQQYFYILMVPIYEYIFHQDNSMYPIMQRIIGCVRIYLILIMMQYFIYLVAGVKILQGLSSISMKVGKPYLNISSLGGFFLIFTCYKCLCREKRQLDYIDLAIGLISIVIVNQSRMLLISCLGALMAMILVRYYKTKKGLLVLLAVLIVAASCCFNGTVSEFVDSFSTDEDNPVSGSTLGRINEMEYFQQYMDQHPVLGMGFIRPYRTDLILIATGPDLSCYYDDLGFLGLYYRIGYFAFVIYVPILLRLGYICLRVRRCDGGIKILMSGLFVYLIITSLTIIITDGSRTFLLPIIVAIFEYYYERIRRGDTESEKKYRKEKAEVLLPEYAMQRVS